MALRARARHPGRQPLGAVTPRVTPARIRSPSTPAASGVRCCPRSDSRAPAISAARQFRSSQTFVAATQTAMQPVTGQPGRHRPFVQASLASGQSARTVQSKLHMASPLPHVPVRPSSMQVAPRGAVLEKHSLPTARVDARQLRTVQELGSVLHSTRTGVPPVQRTTTLPSQLGAGWKAVRSARQTSNTPLLQRSWRSAQARLAQAPFWQVWFMPQGVSWN